MGDSVSEVAVAAAAWWAKRLVKTSIDRADQFKVCLAEKVQAELEAAGVCNLAFWYDPEGILLDAVVESVSQNYTGVLNSARGMVQVWMQVTPDRVMTMDGYVYPETQ